MFMSSVLQYEYILPTLTILFTLADGAGRGCVSVLGSISSSGARSGLSENMLSKSICLK